MTGRREKRSIASQVVFSDPRNMVLSLGIPPPPSTSSVCNNMHDGVAGSMPGTGGKGGRLAGGGGMAATMSMKAYNLLHDSDVDQLLQVELFLFLLGGPSSIICKLRMIALLHRYNRTLLCIFLVKKKKKKSRRRKNFVFLFTRSKSHKDITQEKENC